MPKQKSKRVKHIPQRTCVGCREVLSKRELIRVVKTDTGIKIDPSGKAPGRGAYIHNRQSCWQKALKGKLSSALRMELSESDRLLLTEVMQSMPEDTTEDDQDEETMN